jgi:hypothetical protein
MTIIVPSSQPSAGGLGTQTPSQQPTESNLLMAAASMHQMGRLVEPEGQQAKPVPERPSHRKVKRL